MILLSRQRQLVYLLYGKQEAYRHEAKFSILSAIRETPPASMPRILIYTDEPSAFEGWPVDVVFLDDETLGSWSGDHDYLHRRKAVAIREALEFAEISIFIDTDTFFLGSAEKLFLHLADSHWLVDELEGRWGDWNDQPLYHVTADRLAREHGIGDDMRLINSGVLGLHRSSRELMDRAIELIDELHPLAPDIHVVEQFAVSAAAYGCPAPAHAQGVVKHYYSDKLYWRKMLASFFMKHGESYSASLVSASRKVPKVKPKPVWIRRLLFRLRSLGMSKKERKLARLAFYAVNLPASPYSQACAVAYAHDVVRASRGQPCSGGQAPRWLKPLSGRQRSRLLEMLESIRVPSGGSN